VIFVTSIVTCAWTIVGKRSVNSEQANQNRIFILRSRIAEFPNMPGAVAPVSLNDDAFLYHSKMQVKAPYRLMRLATIHL
jgi:hypothetical protein